MNAVLRDQVLRAALETVRDIIDPAKKDLVAARRAREVAVKALFATKGPDPLMLLASTLAIVAEQLAGELEAAHKAAAAGQMWPCIDTPQLLAAARETLRDARAVGIRTSGRGVGSCPDITPTGPL